MPRIPQNNIWKQGNRSDKFFDIVMSQNLDPVSSLGNLRISPRMILNQDSNDDSDIGIPCAFKRFTTDEATDKLWWMIAGANLFYGTAGIDGDVTKFATVPHPSGFLDADYSDMDIHGGNGELHIFSASTTAHRINASGTSNSIANALATAAGLHATKYFRAQNKQYTIDNSSKGVSSIDASQTIVLSTSGSQYSINNLADNVNSALSWIAVTSTRIWLGTFYFNGKGSKVYAWDGSTASGPNEVYNIEAGGSCACIIKDDTPYVIDSLGRLLKFNGGTFVEVDRLPIDFTKGKYAGSLWKGTNRLVHYNGIDLVDGKINMLVNFAPYVTDWPAAAGAEKVPSGIWEYTEETGLYHKNSLGNTKSGGTINDYGQKKLKYVGALASLSLADLNTTAGSINGSYIAGAEYYTTATVSAKGLWYDDFANTLQKAGYFVTSKIFSTNIADIWQQIVLRFRKFLNSSDKIVVKYRTDEKEPSEATITYTSTTTFTVTLASTDNALAVGDEVEFLQGVGAGRTAHITAISGSHAASQTITVDETITGATTQTAKARFQTWKKLGTFNSQTEEIYKLPIDKGNTSVWVQFKVWILWTGKNELYDVIISNKLNEKIE